MSPYSTGSNVHETGKEKLGMFAHLTGAAKERAVMLDQQQAMLDELSRVLQIEEKPVLDASDYFNASAHQGPKTDAEERIIESVASQQNTDPSFIVQDAAVSIEDMKRTFHATNDKFAIG